MKKAFLKKIVVGVITATTMTTLTPLGVSAATNNTIDANSHIFNLNKVLKTGWLYYASVEEKLPDTTRGM